MFVHRNLCLISTFFLLVSCVPNASSPNIDNTDVPTTMPVIEISLPEATPLPKSDTGEVILLLRKRERPSDVVVLRLPQDCLIAKTDCEPSGNILGVLPQNLSQVSRIHWANDGNQAFFWDENTGDIYVLDGNQGSFQIFKKEVWKVRDHFVISPDGNRAIFEIQKGDYETDLVSMDINTGDLTQFDIPEICAKYISGWIDKDTILFWCEYNEGKGYLAGVKVFTLDTVDQSIRPFEIGYESKHVSIPEFSPDKKFMDFMIENKLVIRDVSKSVDNEVDVQADRTLWSMDSKVLAIYDQSKDIYSVKLDGSEKQKLYSLADIGDLEDWMWLPDNNHILLIIVDNDGNRTVGVLSVVDKMFNPLPLSLLNGYDPISISFRP